LPESRADFIMSGELRAEFRQTSVTYAESYSSEANGSFICDESSNSLLTWRRQPGRL
jgi:hypothetical protein